MKISKSSLTGIVQLANRSTNSADRDRAFDAMKRTMKQTISMCNAESVKDMFETLNKNKIALKSVEIMCKKICGNQNERRKELEKIIMKWKLRDAKSMLVLQKKKLTKEWRNNNGLFKKMRINRSFEEIVRQEKIIMRRNLKKKKKKKIGFLIKRKEKDITIKEDNNTDRLCKTVKTYEQEIPETFSSEPEVYGGAEINKNEHSILSLPPKYTLFEKINKEKCMVEIETMVTKYRWELMKDKNQNQDNMNTNDESNSESTQDTDQNVNIDKEKENNKEIREYHFDINENKFDFRKLRPTDLPYNKRVYLPENTGEEEIQITYLSHELEQITKSFEKVHKCEVNLSKEERLGLKSLKEREDIVVFQTDKSSKFSVDTKTNYIESCEQHTSKDETISEEKYETMIKELNSHSVMWCNFLKAGKYTNSNGDQRIKDNMISSEMCDPPPLYALRKDHKQYNDKRKGPPTRPVCGATGAYNGRLSHVLSMILKEVKKQDEDICESTDDLLSAIEEVNRNKIGNENLVVGSLDVKALYPSLDIPYTAEKVAMEFLESNIHFERESIDVFELGLYLVLTMNDEELNEKGLKEYCPYRKHKRGRKPNITGQASNNKEKRKEMWNDALNQNPSENIIKTMIAQAIRVAIITVMNGHVYKFNSEIKQQKEGGAIGLELTGEIAGVFMTWWDKCMKKLLEEKGINVKMYKRYVDDINIIIDSKYNGEDQDKKMFEEIKNIGNSIHTSIQLETDYPMNYEDKKVPILDVKVWIDEENQVLHEYYAKPMASKAIISQKSAMPLKEKRKIITQDILRIILRCSPLLPWNNVVKHINNYMLRMQFSGYKEKFRKEVLRSAIEAYGRIKREVREGKRPLYRNKQWQNKRRLEEKRNMKTNWYKQKNKNKNPQPKNYKSILFVQPTMGSKLKKEYEKAIERSKCEIKVIERAGTNIKQQIQKSYPFNTQKCKHEHCFICTSNGKGNCHQENITYEIQCGKENCNYIYIGESCRNGMCRGREHLKGIIKKDNESPLYKHLVNEHENYIDKPPCQEFIMNITGTYNKAITRQITEAVKIDTTSKPLMNTKIGFNTNNIIHLTTTSF